MSAMDKIPPVGAESPCGTLQEAPYDLGKGEFPQNIGGNIKLSAGRGGIRPGAGRPLGSPNKPKPRLLQRATGPRWYVVQARRGQEDRVVRELLEGVGKDDRRGYIVRPSFEVYLPRIVVEVILQGKRQAVHKNMFSGYILTRFDHLHEPWPLIREVDGVLDLFTTRGVNPDTGYFTPLPVPVGEIEKLIEEAPKRLKLPEVRLPAYKPGQLLRFETGPFADHRAECIACDGLNTEVRMKMFNRDVEMTRPRSELSLVEADRRSEHDRP